MEKLAWKGYARKDGRRGIRNRLLVIYTVECAHFVAKQIAERAQSIDVECIGFSGCTDNEYAVRMLISLIRHPNVGGVLCVGLGCEYVQPERLAEVARDVGKEAEWFFIQEVGGTELSIKKGLQSVQNLLKAMQSVPLVEMQFKDLIIGAECGGSDYTSGLAGNVW